MSPEALFIVFLITVICGGALLAAYLITLTGYAIKGLWTGEGAYNAMKPVLDGW